jgi:transcription initiation factor TFIIB
MEMETYHKIYLSFFENDEEKKNDESNECFYCKSKELAQDNTLSCYICKNCAILNKEIFDMGPEWRNYDGDGNAGNGEGSRCNLYVNQLLPESSLGTPLSATAGNNVKMLQKWNAMPYKERSLNKIFTQISNKCEKYGIPKKIENDAQILFVKISESKHTSGKNMGKNFIIRGKNRKSIIASCLFAACRRGGLTRLAKEIAQMFEISNADMNKGLKNFFSLIQNYNRTNKIQINVDMGTSKAMHFVKRFSDKLGIYSECTNTALKIANNVENLNLAEEHNAFSISAAIIIMAGELHNKPVDKKKMKEIMNISPVTINETYQKLIFYKKLLLNDEKVLELKNEIDKKIKNQKTPYIVIKRMEKMKKYGLDINLDKYQTNKSKTTNTDDENLNDMLYNLSLLTADEGNEFLRIAEQIDTFV